MNIKDLSDRILVKQKDQYDPIPDPFPYKYFESICHKILEQLEEDGITHTVFWDQNKDMLPSITKAVMAQFLIILGERKAKKKIKNNNTNWEETRFEFRENLVWEEIKKILFGA